MKRTLVSLGAALAFALCAGCGNTAGVTVTFSGAMGVSPAIGGGFAATTGTASVDADNVLDLHAENGQGILDVTLDSPTMPGPVMLGERHLEVSYSLNTGANPPGWSSNGGGITLQSLNPYQITFDNVVMLHATPGVQGTFTLSGSGLFTK